MTHRPLRICLAALLLLPSCGRRSGPPPLTPEEEGKTFRFSEDFHAELFAAEPQVIDPVEMVFDENGKIYVAEMIDYPDDPPPGQPARSRIVVLEDRDGDGRIDHSSVFADHILQVSGMLPYKGGLIVTSAPDILFLKDTNGGGKADVRRVLYAGFHKVNPQHRVTNPRLGIDNWIYVANDGNDGTITSPEHPERPPVLVRGADFRFQPDRGLAEPASGPTQFGMSFDDWGNRFLSSNTFHLHHAVVPMNYLMRAPMLALGAVSQYLYPSTHDALRVFQLTAPQEWRKARTEVRQQRYKENGGRRIEDVGGYFTAASGGTVYTGDAFPREYAGNVFTGEVNGNLIRRDILTPRGATFEAHPAKRGVEFLASTDVWFRPCNFANAPDGLLYMVDIYRQVIEHPEYIPDAIKRHIDFRRGEELGRIWRLVPNRPLRKGGLQPHLGSMSAAELVKQLENPNGWNRETAQRLLVERQDRSVAPQLKELARSSATPQARLRALWTLEGLSALEPAEVLAALQDPDAHIREHGLRLAEEFLPQSKPIAGAVLKMSRDPEPRVRFQLALTLGQLSDARALDVLAGIASEYAADRWFRIAILSSAPNTAYALFERLLAKGNSWQDPQFVAQLASLIGAKHDRRELASLLSSAGRLLAPQNALDGLARGLKLAGIHNLEAPEAEAALVRILSSPSEPVERAAWGVARYLELRTLLKKASADAVAPKLPVEVRAAAILALRGGSFNAVVPVLRQVLDSSGPPELQRAAVESLASFDDPAVGSTLLAYWREYSPEAHAVALDALLNNRERVPLLLKAIEDQQIPAASLEVAARNRLLEYPDPSIAARAKLLLHTEAEDRAKVVASYHDVVSLTGDAPRGKTVFEKNCGRCHLQRRTSGQLGRVGPDLSGVNNKTKDELLQSILNPSASIEPRYINYIITTKDGRIHDGVIANETPGVITLRNGSPEGDDNILRANIAEMRASSISLMPEDLEKSMSHQDIADVIAYLRGGL